MRKRKKEEKRGSNSSGYSWHTYIHQGHEETYTKWIMGQWRGRYSRFTSSGYDSWASIRRGISRGSTTVHEGGRGRNAAVRAHSRLTIHYAKRLNDRNICILVHRGSGEALRRALWVSASQVEERLSVSSTEQRLCFYSTSLARDSRFGYLERASWRVATLGSFECLRFIAQLHQR